MKNQAIEFDTLSSTEIHNHHMDSTIWNDVKFRDDDIVIGSYAKSGTTWTQNIVGQLVFSIDSKINLAELSPWVDFRLNNRAELLSLLDSQTHRRILKTHLPSNAMPIKKAVKYIYIARDPRDVVISLFNHHQKANDFWYASLNNPEGLIGPKIGLPSASIRDYVDEWIDKDGFPFWPYFSNIKSWWKLKNRPNILLIHYHDLKNNLVREVKRIANFLSLPDLSQSEQFRDMVSFKSMRERGALYAPLGGKLWKNGASDFFHKGQNGQWSALLSEDQSDKILEYANRELSYKCKNWLIR